MLAELRTDAAYSRNYGNGLAGTNGIPGLSLAAPPVIGTDVTLQFDNSLGAATFGILILGTDQVQWPTGFGGDLLVDPQIVISLSIPAGGGTLMGSLLQDQWLLGYVLNAQVLERDVGAIEGISFSPGLEIGIGL